MTSLRKQQEEFKEKSLERVHEDDISLSELESRAFDAYEQSPLFKAMKEALKTQEAVINSLLAECLYHREEARRRNHYSDALRTADLALSKHMSDRAREVIIALEDKCICGEINARHCPVHNDLPGDKSE